MRRGMPTGTSLPTEGNHHRLTLRNNNLVVALLAVMQRRVGACKKYDLASFHDRALKLKAYRRRFPERAVCNSDTAQDR